MTKTQVKHTPGLWISTGDGEIHTVKKYRNDPICICLLRAQQITIKEAEANARLIASAPELLEFCKDLLEGIEICKLSNQLAIYVEQIKNLVDKVEGNK